MSACLSAKLGSMVATSGLVVATGEATGLFTAIESYGVIGVLGIVSLALWAKSERQEREAEKRRAEREAREREDQKRLVEALSAMTYAINNLRDHCAAMHRRDV